MRTRSLFLVVFYFLCLLVPGTTVATVRVDDLYDVRVTVADQGREERSRAIRQGMMELLARLSGSQALDQNPALLEVLDRASRYVTQYRYEQRPVLDLAGSEVVVLPSDRQPMELVLWLRFDTRAVTQVIQEHRLPMLGVTRPQALLWLAVEDRGQRYLLNSGSEQSLRGLQMRAAQRSGVPLLLPLLDLEDQARVRVADVWGGFTEVVREASRRYEAEYVLLGKLYPGATGEWEGRWILLGPDREQEWTARDRQLDSVLAASMDGLRDAIMARYAIRSDQMQPSTILVQVSNVHNLAQYAEVTAYLEGVPLVTAVQARSLEQDRLQLELSLRGDTASLERYLGLDKRLRPDEAPVITLPQAPAPPVPPAPVTAPAGGAPVVDLQAPVPAASAPDPVTSPATPVEAPASAPQDIPVTTPLPPPRQPDLYYKRVS